MEKNPIKMLFWVHVGQMSVGLLSQSPILGLRTSLILSTKLLSRNHLQALTKIRKSLRDKKSSSTAGLPSINTSKIGESTSPGLSPRSGRSFNDAIDRELLNLKEDLQATRDEASASKEVINVLRTQLEEVQREKETL